MVAAPQINAQLEPEEIKDGWFPVLSKKEMEEWVDTNLRTDIKLDVESDYGKYTFELDRLLNQIPTEELAKAMRRRLYESDELLPGNMDISPIHRATIMHQLVNLHSDVDNAIREHGAMSYANEVDLIGIEEGGVEGRFSRYINRHGCTEESIQKFITSDNR